MRAAALAFALSSWVEGLTQFRTALLMPYLPRDGQEDDYNVNPAPPNDAWKDRILSWLTRKGRDMDDMERMSLGVLDVTVSVSLPSLCKSLKSDAIQTAFMILQSLNQPLLPFLLSPLSTTLPLPRSTSGFKPIKWPCLVLSTFLLSLLHEAERATVCLVVDRARKHRETKNRELFGEVYVRGDALPPGEDDGEEEEECLICAGVGADASLSHSISSLSSIATVSASMDAPGPLEAFCVTAPKKHVAHRSCFLSWHAAYRQQRMDLNPEPVELRTATVSEAVRKRARAMLDVAGFSYLGSLIKFPYELVRIRAYPPRSGSRQADRPTLTLNDDTASSGGGSLRPVATLHTTTPPCPGCRGSVLLHFISCPRRHQARPPTRKEVVRVFVQIWIKQWCRLVTGKTILYRSASQWSFVMALLSVLRVMRVSGGTIRWAYV